MAQALVSKYADHLPLYRQAQIYARQGVRLDRSTLADWVGRAAFHLRPVHERPTARPPSRSRILPGSRASFRSTATPAFRALAEKGDVTLAFCWAHLRRRFYERFVSEASPIAAEALQRVAALYRIETDIRGREPDERRAVRRERSRPLLAELEPWLTREARPHQSEEQARRGHSLRALALERPHALPRGRPHRSRHQSGRARDPPDRDRAFIVRLIFKCLETLEAAPRNWSDTGCLSGRSPR